MNYDDEHLLSYVNGKLDGDQQQKMQADIAQDTELANEIALLRAMKQGWQDDEPMPPADLGLARLKRDIAQEPSGQNEVPPASEPPKRQRHQGFWKPVALAACLIVAVQTSVVMFQSTSDTQWSLLSGDSVASLPRLQIAPDPNMTLVELEALLHPYAAEIVAGPGALGIYTLQLPQGSDIEQIQRQLADNVLIEEVSLP